MIRSPETSRAARAEAVFRAENDHADETQRHAQRFAAGDRFEPSDARQQENNDGCEGDDDRRMADGRIFQAKRESTLIDDYAENAEQQESFDVPAIELCAARRKEKDDCHNESREHQPRGHEHHRRHVTKRNFPGDEVDCPDDDHERKHGEQHNRIGLSLLHA